jgi:maltose/moltooligosaccharide transporter
MPYAMLAGCLPPERMGVYMGVFNLFIVLPNMVASLTFQPLVKHVFHNNPLWVVMMGGACLLLAAVSVAFVDDHAEDPISSGAVLAGDRHETFTTTETAQPVPSTGLIDGKKRT